MRALYFTLCIIAVTALPPRQYKKIAERKLELTTEAKIETPEQPTQKDEPADKEIPDKEKVPSVRAYYENQSVNVVSSTTATVVDSQEKQFLPQVNYAVPQVNIGRPQINVNPVNTQPQQYAGNLNQKKKEEMEEKKNVYTVNVYVNFPNDQEYESEDEECYKGKCWGKAKCKEGQVSVKGVCTAA